MKYNQFILNTTTSLPKPEGKTYYSFNIYSNFNKIK